ncbi:carbamoyltransferase C-terminal domain-containing protein [Streptomyces mirabilis]|uniref:carbamoyltransferase C-terminal domain-containing protein n=1 Tax=Streptomyces mirabilis TaxID=68239 RepID=UPI00331FE5B7
MAHPRRAPPVRSDHADKIAGVVHMDGTARVQTVDPATAPAYGALIEHFHQLTGVPVVLNTSFNDREPIVEAPAHALATLQACDLDAAASAHTWSNGPAPSRDCHTGRHDDLHAAAEGSRPCHRHGRRRPRPAAAL